MSVCSKWKGIILHRGTYVRNTYNWDSWHLFSLHTLRGEGVLPRKLYCGVALVDVMPAAKGVHIRMYADHGCVYG